MAFFTKIFKSLAMKSCQKIGSFTRFPSTYPLIIVNCTKNKNSNLRNIYNAVISIIITSEKLNATINTFKHINTPRRYGLLPITIQKAEALISDQLIWLYTVTNTFY